MVVIEKPRKEHTFIFDREDILAIIYSHKELYGYIKDIEPDPLICDFCCSFDHFEGQARLESITDEIAQTFEGSIDYIDVTYSLYAVQDMLQTFIFSHIGEDECSYWVDSFTDTGDVIVVSPDTTYQPKHKKLPYERNLYLLRSDRKVQDQQRVGCYRRSLGYL